MTSANTGGSLIGKIGSYLQIVVKDPSSTAFVPLAEAYRQTGLLDDALEVAKLGTKRLPHFSPGFSTMGRILGQMGRIDEAMSAYARALSIDRQSQSGLVGLARLHLIRSERDQARKILRQAEEFHPDDEKIADMLNALDLPRPWAQIKQESHVQETVSQEAVAPDVPEEPIPTATLAEIYVKQGLLVEAVNVYQDILKQNPDNTAAHQRMLQLQSESPELKSESQELQSESQELQSEPPESQSESRGQSLLTVFQNWLTAIKHVRANNSGGEDKRESANV